MHHKLLITDEAIQSAAQLSERYITDRFLPDKAIDLIDESSARVRMYKAPQTKRLQVANAAIKSVQKERELALEERRYDDAEDLRAREEGLQGEIDVLRAPWDPDAPDTPRLLPEDIAEMVAMWTGIPVTQIAGEETARLMHMEEDLHTRIVGQDEAIVAISKAVRRARTGLKDPKRPIGSFIFLGPTGVGKSELTKALAHFMFGSEEAMVQLDMSEFMERHSVARLVGSPPGYVGHDEGGQLTEMVRRKPYSVILFDEIEKAHPDVFNILLQILEDGRLTDSQGRTVDFRNSILIMTSNIGAEMITKDTPLGFGQTAISGMTYDDMKGRITGELKRVFKPEFLNRVDEVIIFHRLSLEHIKGIVDIQLGLLRKRLAERDIALDITDAAKSYLAHQGYDPAYGARPLKRLIQKEIQDQVALGILKGDFRDGDTIRVDERNLGLVFERLAGLPS
jgi:ATP-dependent Clp protease ATP-binding subunit ClpC